MAYSKINERAAAVTGAIVGLLCWVLGLGVGFGGMPMYNLMNGMMGGYYGYSGLATSLLVSLAIAGAIVGAVIGFVYNWALEL